MHVVACVTLLRSVHVRRPPGCRLDVRVRICGAEDSGGNDEVARSPPSAPRKTWDS